MTTPTKTSPEAKRTTKRSSSSASGKPKAPKKPRAKRVKPVYRTFFIDDNSGNKLRIESTDKQIVLTLLLKGDYKRKIGTVTKSTKTLVMKRKKALHLMRVNNSYGFCDYVLQNLTYATWIRLSDDDGGHWKIPVSYMKDTNNGTYLHFKAQGFETQKFFTLTELHQFKVTKKSKRRF